MANVRPLVRKNGVMTQMRAGVDTIDPALFAVPGRNMLINGGITWWQRGSAGTVTDWEVYSADRWSVGCRGEGITCNWGIGTFDASDLLPINNPPRNFLGFNLLPGLTAAWARQKIEGATTFHNGKATVSFWMRCAKIGNMVGIRLVQEFPGGGDPSVTVYGDSFQLTPTFQKFTYTFDVPSLNGKNLGNIGGTLQIIFDFNAPAPYYNGDVANQQGLFEFTNVQFEAGSVATDFERRPAALELHLCQRYYEKSYSPEVNPGTTTVPGSAGSGARTGYYLHAPCTQFTVAKRAPPSIMVYSPQSGQNGNVAEYNTIASFVANRVGIVLNIGQTNFELILGNGDATPNNTIRWHWTADSEL